MANRFYTLLLVPERSAAVRRIQVPKALVLAAAIAALGMAGVTMVAAIHYGYVVDQVFENRALRDENARLRSQFAGMDKRVVVVEDALSNVRRMEQKLRSITRLSDPPPGPGATSSTRCC